MTQQPETEEKTIEKTIFISCDVDHMQIDLSRPRVIRVVGKTSDGREREWLMKVTNSEKLVLV